MCFWCWYRKTQFVFSVPSGCTAYWTEADWDKIMRPPLIQLRLECSGTYFYATRSRDARGDILYSSRI